MTTPVLERNHGRGRPCHHQLPPPYKARVIESVKLIQGAGMFFMKWLLAAVIALVINAGVFALLDFYTQLTLGPTMCASVSTLVTAIVMAFVLFPRKKKKKP